MSQAHARGGDLSLQQMYRLMEDLPSVFTVLGPDWVIRPGWDELAVDSTPAA